PPVTVGASFPILVLAGLLVGFGARLGAGCTSGHGVCGIGRGSPRSLAATGTFMAIAVLTVLVMRHLVGA
ncbi:YeeE/YedE family protein, partial [Methylobacterium sp. NFXW15]|uniref:YeeE/YedE family protein n=1 Tax=Methylobacterium sp. NFXW15 TaxID=2819512 RepID=UPI003CEEECA7